jgi:hypothetical protein
MRPVAVLSACSQGVVYWYIFPNILFCTYGLAAVMLCAAHIGMSDRLTDRRPACGGATHLARAAVCSSAAADCRVLLMSTIGPQGYFAIWRCRNTAVAAAGHAVTARYCCTAVLPAGRLYMLLPASDTTAWRTCQQLLVPPACLAVEGVCGGPCPCCMPSLERYQTFLLLLPIAYYWLCRL